MPSTSPNDAFLCRDLGEFKRVLDKMRQNEDKIIFRLNCELPTNSFSKKLDKRRICEDIQNHLLEVRKVREHLLKRCSDENDAFVKQFRDDSSRVAELKTAKTNLHLIREEKTVEDIVRMQSDKVLRERCRKELLL